MRTSRKKRESRDSSCEHSQPVNGRRAVAVDPAIKAANLRRLGRIESQVRGLAKMVEDERYCADIIMQLAAVQEALRAVGRELLRNHVRHCAAAAIRGGGEAEAEIYRELLDLIYKSAR